MQETESTRSVLEYLSFEADQEMTMPSTPRRNGSASESARPMHMQGILWKRRDVFRNRWRPRWFVLHADQRLLTYYILSNQESSERVVSGSSTSTPSRRRSSAAFAAASSSSISVGSERIGSYRNNDESSVLSAQTIDCDVVPRGTIYLFGSTVEANEALTIPQEDLYTLTITDHENGSHCHLAARTLESRDEWIQCIRRVCENGNGAQNQEQRTNRVPYSPQTPMPNRRSYQSDSQQNNDQHNGTDNVAGEALPGQRNSNQEMEILVVFAPLLLYKVLTMMSYFGLAALGFVLTSTMALRWIIIQRFLRVLRPLTDESDSSSNAVPIGHGSICCRLTEDLTAICRAGNEASLSHILVWSIAKSIRQQPGLVSKKYKLLPPFYSNDIVYLDLDDNTSDESDGVWVSKADEKNLHDIADYFKRTKHQQHLPVGFLQNAIGPACRIVTTSDGEDDFNEGVQLELNLPDCPITVFVACNNRAEQSRGKVANIAISFQSTDVNACRKFTENFQKSIRSTKI